MSDTKFSASSLDEDEAQVTQAVATIALVSRTQTRHRINRQLLLQSQLCAAILADDAECSEISLASIDGDTIDHVIAYLLLSASAAVTRVFPKPLPTNNIADCVHPWEATFILSLSQHSTLQLLLCANYLSIDSLIALCSAAIAALLLNKTPREVQREFTIRSDLTIAEEEEIKRDYRDVIE